MLAIVERLLKLLPALVAGGLALVYILGAIVAGSEFEGTGVDARDAVPLLSLEQILARGIGVIVNSLPSLLLIFAGLLLMTPALARISSRPLTKQLQTGWSSRSASSRFLMILGVLLMILGLLVVPVNQLPGFFITVLGLTLIFALSQYEPPNQGPQRPLYAAIAIAFFFIGLGVTAYTDPVPAPEVEIERTRNQPPAIGTLITHSNATWYVFRDSVDQIRAYPDDSVESATVFKRPSGDSNDGATVAEYIGRGLTWASPF